jgi:GxxExxY protein
MEFVDDDAEPDPELKRVTNLIIGAAIAVHRELGPGHAESAYHNALRIEFDAKGIVYGSQHRFELLYRGQRVGEGFLDFLVEAVVVEIKSVEALAPVQTAQVISYLRATKLRLALLINFNVKLLKEGIKRVSC